jgi:hypothetical protein
MATSTEKRIVQARRTKKTGAKLVPVLELLLEETVDVEDEADFKFIEMLLRARAYPRQPEVFSPSMLGSCIRQAYLSKRGEEKLPARNPQTHSYFLNGNFVHFKWQFAVWKAHRAGLLTLPMIVDQISKDLGMSERPAVEVRVGEGDNMGTIDTIVIFDQAHVVDFKGLRLDEFQKTVRKGAPIPYRRQLVGYSELAIVQYPHLNFGNPLLISECKAGPVSGVGSSIALHETEVPMEEFAADVQRRLKTLRWYDGRNELPEIECRNTQHMQFQGCPFNKLCHDEVIARQRELQASAEKRSKPLTVARPQR